MSYIPETGSSKQAGQAVLPCPLQGTVLDVPRSSPYVPASMASMTLVATASRLEGRGYCEMPVTMGHDTVQVVVSKVQSQSWQYRHVSPVRTR